MIRLLFNRHVTMLHLLTWQRNATTTMLVPNQQHPNRQGADAWCPNLGPWWEDTSPCTKDTTLVVGLVSLLAFLSAPCIKGLLLLTTYYFWAPCLKFSVIEAPCILGLQNASFKRKSLVAPCFVKYVGKVRYSYVYLTVF